jgi:hypothetical protein
MYALKLLNKLPNYIKTENIPKQFNSTLKNYLLNSTFWRSLWIKIIDKKNNLQEDFK